MTAPQTFLSIRGVQVKLGGVPVLDIPSLDLLQNESVSLIGPNGSGKSTLLLLMNSLVKPSSGSISYHGEALDSQDKIFRYRRKVCAVFQQPLLFDTTVYKNVATGLGFRAFSASETDERVIRYLKCFQIEHLADRSARKLSGGESQRTSLARAFAIEPEIVLLDEPFSALDPPARFEVIQDLLKIIAKTGITLVMATHVESEALSISRRILVMSAGRIVQSGTPAEIISHPANEFAARFVGREWSASARRQ